MNSYKAKLAAELSTATRGVGATAGAARQRVSELSAAFEQQKAKMLELKQQREEATLLARDVANAQQIYDSALQRYGQSRMEAQSTQTDIAVLNPAVPPTQNSSPKTVPQHRAVGSDRTHIGHGIGFMVEMLDRRVRSGLDIAGDLDIPVLAELGGSDSWLSYLRRRFTRARLLRA